MSARTEIDRWHFNSRKENFLGIARVPIDQLQFQSANVSCQGVDPKNVRRLVENFKLEGCLRLEPDHAISATVKRADFLDILGKIGVPSSALYTQGLPPLIDFSGLKINCQYGRHRIKAAKQFLDPSEDWWVVHFYDQELENKTLRSMQDEYSNAMNFCHGDIYCNIIAARRAGDEDLEGRWLSRLNPPLRTDLKPFLNKEVHQDLRVALNSLIPFSGLWPALKLGCLRRIISLHQPEELSLYLNTTRQIWEAILLGQEKLFGSLDCDTVKALQLRNPIRYIEDTRFLQDAMNSGTIFREIKDSDLRGRILERLLKISNRIPSIETFLKDTRWLEPCTLAVRKHISPKSDMSLSRTLSSTFDYKMIKERNDQEINQVDLKRREFTLAYRRLFAFAWRHFPELSGISPKQDQGKPEQVPRHSNQLIQYEFKKYAFSLGFRSSKTSTATLPAPETKMIQQFLYTVRPSDLFRLKGGVDEEIISRIYHIIKDNYERCGVQKSVSSEDSSLDSRCGRPTLTAWNTAKASFRYEHIYKASGNYESSVANHRDIFALFFGEHDGPMPPSDASNSKQPDVDMALETQTAQDIYQDSSEGEALSDRDYDRNDNSRPSKRRYNEEPPRKVAKREIVIPNLWFSNVLVNAEKLGMAPQNAGPRSHIVVFDYNLDKLSVLRRDDLKRLFKECKYRNIMVEEIKMSQSGEMPQLQSSSQILLELSSHLLGRKLIYLCNNSGDELVNLVEWHKGHYREIWEKLKILSAEPGSYF